MREVVPVVVPWVVMFATLTLSYQIEARVMRARPVCDASTGLPLARPSVGYAALATLLLGPLMAPIFFWRSRRKPLGLLLGLALTALSVGLFVVAALASRTWLVHDTLARADAACVGKGPLAPDPESVKREGPCAALVEALESGTGCLDGAKLVSCSERFGRPFTLKPEPARARALLEHRCEARQELSACLALGERASSDGERQAAAANVRRVCCKWWETGVCERFLSVSDCKR